MYAAKISCEESKYYCNADFLHIMNSE